MSIGNKIRSARKAAGLTQKELGKRLGISYQTIAQWENNLRNPKIETLHRISDALSIDLFELIPDDQKRGFEHIPSYFDSENADEREKAHKIEEILANKAVKISHFEQLYKIGVIADSAIDKSLKEFDESVLTDILIDSFNALNLRGKYEAVERVAELELSPRFTKKPPQE